MLPVFSLKDVIYREILSIPMLEIPAGSLFGITGKSGSGKTTLLRLLNNMISCEQGEISYFRENILTLDPVALRRKVVMVPQSSYIFPKTVRENIRLAFYFNHKEPPAQDEMEQLLSVLGMSGMLDRDTFDMSGGEKLRLALARALLLDPETLLLDEPTAALDEDNAGVVVDILAQWVRRTGKSAVMISHAAGIIREHADLILNLSGGRIINLEERRSANA
jgi:putative ABC transport system ATP-binding protein